MSQDPEANRDSGTAVPSKKQCLQRKSQASGGKLGFLYLGRSEIPIDQHVSSRSGLFFLSTPSKRETKTAKSRETPNGDGAGLWNWIGIPQQVLDMSPIKTATGIPR